ncbi:hypothetical protein [Sunxiuqinia indica]|uniref:hypothetical protein n=1 Tax=Sunxiuqinia indica TaxID=2692584 RepID=UPI001357B7C4|nr:hypothetical protein [Sunxiuqinia indica]
MPFRFQQIEDSTYLDSSFFSNNKTLAQQALAGSPWREEISKKDFEEYILPYKIDDELADRWREKLYGENRKLLGTNPQLNNADSLYAYHMKKTYYALNSSGDFDRFYPTQPNYSWLSFAHEGDCADRCRYVIYHLRAAGLPATYDYLPDWGNRPKAQHAFVGLANKKRQLEKLLENSNDTSNLIDDFNAAMTSKYRPVFSEGDVPSSLTVQYEKTIPKVYRQTWRKQPLMEDLVSSVPENQLYQKLMHTNMLDVIDQYLKTADASVWQRPFGKWDMAYLATFDIGGWTPVAFARYSWWGQARFKAMGKNILYLPMGCKNQKLLPVDVPFILDANGDKNDLACNYQKRINMKLIRKFPLFSYTAAHVVDLKGCVVYGSNDYRFGEREKLAEIDHYPFFMERIEVNNSRKFRYIGIKSSTLEKIRLAHLSCIADSCDLHIAQSDVRYKKGELTGQQKNLFDNDLNSFTVDTMLVMDLGYPKEVIEVEVCPRSDTNYIIPGNQYELFYWDNRWHSAGKQTATDYSLEYSNVPSGTIYWLRCLSGGREERIFTYKNSKQEWW